MGLRRQQELIGEGPTTQGWYASAQTGTTIGHKNQKREEIFMGGIVRIFATVGAVWLALAIGSQAG